MTERMDSQLRNVFLKLAELSSERHSHAVGVRPGTPQTIQQSPKFAKVTSCIPAIGDQWIHSFINMRDSKCPIYIYI